MGDWMQGLLASVIGGVIVLLVEYGIIQLSSRNSPTDLHHQRHRRLHPRGAQGR